MLNVGDIGYTTAEKYLSGAYDVKIVNLVFDPDTKQLTHYVFKVYTHVDNYISMKPVSEIFTTAMEAEKAVDEYVTKEKEFKKKLRAMASELTKRTRSA